MNDYDVGTDTTDGDLGDAITQLQSAMNRLNDDSTTLGEATAKLQESTRELSETQASISRQTSRTATQLRERDSTHAEATAPPTTPTAGD